jgi:hypothetical protein
VSYLVTYQCFWNSKHPKIRWCYRKKTFVQAVIAGKKRKVNEGMFVCIAGFAGQRARVPPDPIPNSEVKPCSVPNCSVVFGHVKLGKLAAYFNT